MHYGRVLNQKNDTTLLLTLMCFKKDDYLKYFIKINCTTYGIMLNPNIHSAYLPGSCKGINLRFHKNYMPIL